ncbi:MAG: prolyl oligopeptidase family serine peptidase [Flavobacteriales bacterium]|nr:prolyl oligopeptidase family serine peptidase [Flavobacteriales bacterium]
MAEVPFVDVANTMLDASLPPTTGEYDEWGDPRKPMRSNGSRIFTIRQRARSGLSGTSATTGFHDSQVQYWEPAKWVSRLREHQHGDRPILLWTNMEAGHGRGHRPF